MLVRTLIRSLITPNLVSVHVSSLSDALDADYRIGDRPVRLEIPVQKLSMQGAYSYGGWHPFVAALNHGLDQLETFYSRFQPETLKDMYFLEDLDCDGLPCWELPWVYRERRSPPPGEAGLGASEGVSFYGPATAIKVEVEYKRLTNLLERIKRDGYRPDRYGDIEGHFIRVGSEYRFFVRGGKHRCAALTVSGRDTIPVILKPNWPRIIDADGAEDWPLVRSGSISKKSALAVLERYVIFDGSQ